MAHDRAGTPAQHSDLVDLDALVGAYSDSHPDPDDPAQQVVFGTSGHRGSSLAGAFTDDHIAAITQAVCEHRAAAGITGPLFLGADSHALSAPALATALEVLAANGVTVALDAADRLVPTPSLSHAILRHNRGDGGGGAADGSGAGGMAGGSRAGGIAGGSGAGSVADGIVVTPSHNPPSDGGFKYNPPHGGPAGSDITGPVQDRANQLLRSGLDGVRRIGWAKALAADTTVRYDFLRHYVDDLPSVLDLDAVRSAGLRIGADPLGGASVDYWGAIAEIHRLDLTVVNPTVDPQFGFMTLDHDGRIRMDCSSPYAMASLVARMRDGGADNGGGASHGGAPFDLATGNDTDADRHGVVTPDGGLMNPNHYLAVLIDYLLTHRPDWSTAAGIGKTAVSSSMIDRVVAGAGRKLVEVPVGFKWFVDGLTDGTIAFGGEESAGVSFLRRDGRVWTTDKDGILACLAAAEITAVTGQSPSQRYAELTSRYGDPVYRRVDAPIDRERKVRLASLSADQVTTDTLAGDPVTAVLTEAPGNGAALGGLKVTSDNGWFAARPSGTEDVYKIYAESFVGTDHLDQLLAEAQQLVDGVLA